MWNICKGGACSWCSRTVPRGAGPDPWRTQPLFAALDSERRCARVFINRHHQLEWPAGCILSAHEVYHLIKPIDEREAFS